jgi:hypothetical protein
MKKNILPWLTLMAILWAPEARALDILPGVEKNLILHLGARSLDAGFWAPLETQGVFGMELDFKPEDWPVGFMAGLMFSAVNKSAVVIAQGVPISADFESSITELDAGARRYFPILPWLNLYLNAGASVFSAEVKVGSRWTSTQASSSSGVGLFYGGGAALRFGAFSAGMDARRMNGQRVTIFGDKGKADYTQFNFALGWSF